MIIDNLMKQQSALMGGYQSRPVGFGADSSS